MLRKMFQGIVISLLFCMFMIAPAVAGDAGTFTLSPMVGYHKIDGGMDLDDSVAFGLGFGYNYTPEWSVEADVRMTPTETEGSGSIDVDIWTVSIGALRHFQTEAKLSPYLSFGAGIMAYQVDGPDDEDPLGYWGGGFNYSLSDSTDFRIDLRHILDYRSDNSGSVHDSTRWRHHLQAMLGVTYQFGGKSAPMAKPEPAPAPAPAPTPVDSDKDGVLDPDDQCPGTAPGIRVDSVGCPADSDGDGVADYMDACVDTPQGTEVDKNGCPKAEEVASLTLNVLFGVDKSDVTPFHTSELNRAAAFIKKYPKYNVVVEGYTDSQGSHQYNQDLSQRRAESIRDALVNKYGFSASQISAKGYGETQPVASNATSKGRAKNRRVEISIRP